MSFLYHAPSRDSESAVDRLNAYGRQVVSSCGIATRGRAFRLVARAHCVGTREQQMSASSTASSQFETPVLMAPCTAPHPAETELRRAAGESAEAPLRAV